MLEVLGKHINLEQRVELDYYPTDPKCTRAIIEKEQIKNLYILENSVGNGHIAKELIKANNNVFGIDIKQREYPLELNADFLLINIPTLFGEIKLNKKFDCAVYNPPFSMLNEFIEKTWEFTDKQYVFCRIQVLETKARYEQIFKKGYLEKVYIFSNRVNAAERTESSAMCFCWIVLNKNYKDEPIIRWL
jgi:predicted RNA methylase